jgi:hypothetical protein
VSVPSDGEWNMPYEPPCQYRTAAEGLARSRRASWNMGLVARKWVGAAPQPTGRSWSINVSAGGLALTHFGPAAVEGVVNVQFVLPSTESRTFQAKAAVVWNDAATMGLRFLRIEPGSRSCFEAWLDSLEAQLQFRESAQASSSR